MERPKVIMLVILMVFSLAAIYLLFKSANLPNEQGNGFKRNYIKEIKEPIIFKIISKATTRISGITDGHVYFSGRDPGWALVTDKGLNVIDTLYFGIEYSEQLRDPEMAIDSPNVYMYAKEISYLLKSSTDSFYVDTVPLRTELFTRVAQISPNRLAIRGIDSTQIRQVFKILDAQSGEVIHILDLFPNQQFGGFEYDGKYRYDSKTGNLIFIPMYENGIYCMDSTLTLVYHKNTIDTVFNNGVQIGLVNQSGTTKVMAKAPRQMVNKDFDVNDGKIFVWSGLRGDDEQLHSFNKIIPIDEYDILTGNYIGSYALPKLKGEKLLEFKVRQNFLFAVYESGYAAVFALEVLSADN